jgi:hypothetical protein
LACEAWIAAVLVREGKPVTATAPTRFVSKLQRLALQARDRHCQFPGCGHTLRLKAHHIVHAAHGGPTHVDNLVLLCQQHHTLVHKPGWALTREAGGSAMVARSDGTRVGPGERPPPGGHPPGARPGSAPHRTPSSGDRLTTFAHDVIQHHLLEAG